MTIPRPSIESAKLPFRVPKLLLCLAVPLLLAGAGWWPARSGASNNRSNNPAEETQSEKRQRPEFVPGEALVRFKKNHAFEGSTLVQVRSEDANSPLATRLAPETVRVTIEKFAGSDIVEGLRIVRTSSTDTLTAIAALRARSDVIYAEPNYIVRPERNPNDPRFISNELYGLSKIAAAQAWDITTGSKNIVVAVIDEGIDLTHEDLQANIWTNPSPGSIPGITGDIHGYDFRTNTGTITPELHATHVAGTIGGVGNNGVGVVGVNWDVSLMSLRFISAATGTGTDADAIKAYNYVKQMRDLWVSSGGTQGANIRVINASFGGGGFSRAAADAITALGQSGVLLVAAAGNERSNNDFVPHYPSNYDLPNVVSVGASNQSDQEETAFTNYGPQTVWLFAPGSSILSTTPANGYGTLSGTSMATPHVSGAAALLYSLNPNLAPGRARALLALNGDLANGTQNRTISGLRLNAFKSIQAMNEGDTTPPGGPTNFRIDSRLNVSADLRWTDTGDDGTTGAASLYEIRFLDKFTGAESALARTKPLSSPFTTTNGATVTLPYRHPEGSIKLHAVDNVGNEGPSASVAIKTEAMIADPYEVSERAAEPLSTGGAALGLTFDDRYVTYDLPISFPFITSIGPRTFNSVIVSTNGNLYFFDGSSGQAPPKRSNGLDADDVPSSTNQLSHFQMISGMWDDLDLRTSRRADADVYVVGPDSAHPDRIIFRWQGVQFGDGTNGDPINFEIELSSSGLVVMRYGAGNTNLLPVVGLGGGIPDAYVVDSHTSELSPRNLTNAPTVVFTRRTRPTLLVSSPTYNVNEADGHATVTLTRTGDVTAGTTVTYATEDLGPSNCAGNNGAASSRCDYIPMLGTLTFAPNEPVKTVDIPIVDDKYAEGNENFGFKVLSAFDAIGTPQATINIIDNDNTSGPSPLSATGFFVRQQYLDFLNREPDAPGLAFWIDNIDKCNDPARRLPGLTQAQCIEVQRINTSGAFFLSIEFQETGYLVERIYKTAFGDATGVSTIGGNHDVVVPFVRLTDFLSDTQRIGQGVVVNQGNWQQQLESNKQAFAEDFVQRSAFLGAFPFSLTSAQFVDKLNDNAKDANGNKPLSQAERDQMVNDLLGGTRTRAQVLRAIAEDIDLKAAEFNRAFVLMQYFGYLRRNPNEAPEPALDYSGYDFWLTKLNQFNGNYIQAEMVKAFLSSVEYGQRFSP